MRMLYLDCGMGAAGDMLTAALYELLDDVGKAEFLAKMNSLGLSELSVAAERSVKCGVVGTHMKVLISGEEEIPGDDGHLHAHGGHRHMHGCGHTHDEGGHGHAHDADCRHKHKHCSMAEIESIISAMPLDQSVRADAIAVYRLLADAESKVHGEPVAEIHFHEVGMIDAIADIVAVCLLMSMLHPDRVAASAVNVGSGKVRCAHGILPVPVPAAAMLLSGIPMYSGDIEGELCTPTGAALLKYFASEFGKMPAVRTEAIGYGMGSKDFDAANCVRAIIGEADGCVTREDAVCGGDERIVELSCNVDDMTGEQIGFALEMLLKAGAVDAFTVPVGMKKSRPGVLICAMCREENRKEVLGALFKHTTTLGVRETVLNRYTLKRRTDTVSTCFGDVRIKRAEGYGVSRAKYEYDDIAGIAEEQDMSISEVIKEISEE